VTASMSFKTARHLEILTYRTHPSLARICSSTMTMCPQLAYVIKHWAKRRRINCPSEGTLSSYGYILCLIHFLQVYTCSTKYRLVHK
jgi:hypothetical protein